MSNRTSSRGIKIVSWVLRVLAATAFFAAGGAKLAGVPELVTIFEQLGFGQWFRIVTGVVEIVGAIALLVPVTAGLGGLLLAVTMVFAVLAHVLLIGGSAAPAAVLLLMTATVGWLHRADTIFSRGRLNHPANQEILR